MIFARSVSPGPRMVLATTTATRWGHRVTHDEITSIDRARMVTFGFGDWQLILTEDRQLAGECVWRDRTVKLSAWLLSRADAAQVTDTILHEIAHTLVGPVAEARGDTVRIEAHGQAWRACARRIGANPDATVHGRSPALRGGASAD